MNFDLSREWLVTNGIGGFASGSVIGCNTRRYHSLLCAATRPPLGRMVLVNKADEILSVGDRTFELGCNQYPGTVHPSGYQWLREFHLDPLPRWIYEVPGAVLQKTLWMPHGENRTVVRYELLEGESVTLSVHAFVTGRDYHGTHRYNTALQRDIERTDTHGCHIRMRPYLESPPLAWSSDGQFHEGGAWYYSVEYAVEQERGLDSVEDTYCPGAWVWQLSQENPSATWVIATEASDLDEARSSQAKELERLTKLGAAADDFRARLNHAADQFIVQRGDGLHTVLAGYPWFSDWGRDTMIALPGLCLTTGRFDIARSILLAFARSMSQGMIPNRFPDAGEMPDTNTVDATLWFFHAVSCYVQASGDEATLRAELYPALREAIEWHLRGTRFGIRADETDGLLQSGEEGTQLTWMDAKVGDWVVTPRTGKPVEIQALWYNALKTMAAFAETCDDEGTKKICNMWARKAKASFAPLFWNDDTRCLFDCIRPDGSRDAAIRPNQIFAVSLPHRLLSAEQEKQVVAAVQRELLTPYGLRSLSPNDSSYRGIYIGDQWQRDGSYHQGTVWGWLLGPFVSAYLKVNRRSNSARSQARQWLQPMQEHLNAAGLGSVSEIFDGDTPHTPRGCFAQAWSVSETLRVLDELEK
jgi:predicted glycogen debranching enzyme